jgi:hypothetical protein
MNQTVIDSTAGQSGQPRGTVRGVIQDVDDPKELGRVRVIFDAMNSEDLPQTENAGSYSESRDGTGGNISHWIDTSPAFKGKQPPGLVGKRVNIAVSNGQYHYAILQDVVHDPQNLVSSAAEKLEIPNNSSMTRLPVYPAGQLPPPCGENHGCMVIEEDGPMNSDWTCVCIKRDGKYLWVRHVDLAHGHAGGNDITQQVDSSGDRQAPGQVGAIWDQVFVTSQGAADYFTAYGTAPRGNPWGVDARWWTAPMDDAVQPDFEPGTLFNQDVASTFVRETGFVDSISGSFKIPSSADLPVGVSSIPGLNIVKTALVKGQEALALAKRAQDIINDPANFVASEAGRTLSGYVPQATKAAIASTSSLGGAISRAFSAVTSAASSAVSAVTNTINSISG